MMWINMNDEVRVRLTDKGRALMRENHAKLLPNYPYTPPEEDKGGWSSWQLWRLMQEFGPHLRMGFDVPFDMEIEIVAHNDGISVKDNIPAVELPRRSAAEV